MSSFFLRLFFVVAVVTLANQAKADAPKVGRAAAAKYFQKNSNQDQSSTRDLASETGSSAGNSGSGTRFLTFGASVYTKSDSYGWGKGGDESGIGKWGVDMSYRLSQYNNLLDYSLRVSYNEYEPNNQRTSKLSFMYAATLPDAESRFPLYFGAGAGAGVFLNQLSGESPLTLDYEVFLGMRLFDIFERTGFYLEGGLKNHLQLTSDGQLNGTYISTGAVFTF